MSKDEPISLRIINGGQAGQGRAPSGPVCFSRGELALILNIYGQQVAAGAWKDYAIDMHGDRAIFSIFRRSSEVPLFRIEKNPGLRRRQGQYSVVSSAGRILKRGHILSGVLRVLELREDYGQKISHFPG